jgi:hypothetical protein
MRNVRAIIQEELESLRLLMTRDFSSVAWTPAAEQIIRWKHASGNGSERYKQIMLKTDRGQSGAILRHGRPNGIGCHST